MYNMNRYLKLKLSVSILSFFLFQVGIEAYAQEPDSENFALILQKKPQECGPVCLQMIAQYHGRMWDLKTLGKFAGMNEDGTTLLGISEAADTIGLKNVGVRTTYKNLLEDAPLPLMAHWDNNHFVVVYKMTDRQVWVADPALGKVKYTKQAFCKHWLTSKEEPNKGVAMLFETKDDFFEVNNQISTSRDQYRKSSTTDLLIKSKKGVKIGLWIDSSIWKLMDRFFNKDFEFTFTAKKGEIYAAFAAETSQMPLELLKTQTHLANLDLDPKAQILEEEYRWVNGLKVLFVKRQVTIKSITFIFMDYYFSSKQGTVKVVTFSSKTLMEKHQLFCEKMMNGLVKLE